MAKKIIIEEKQYQRLFKDSLDENIEKDILVKQFLDSLTREELEALLINYGDIVHVASYSNPLTIQMGKNLHEGLIHTYPIGKTISYVKSYFQLNDRQIQEVQAENEVSHIVVLIPMIGDNIGQVQRAMALCGYYLGYNKEVDTEYGKWVQMQFEPQIKDDSKFKLITKYNNRV